MEKLSPEIVVCLALDAHRIDMHRQGDGPQHLSVQITQESARPGDIAGRAAHRHRGARRRHRQPGSRIEQLFQLALDLGPRVVIRLGRDRLAGEVAAAVSGCAVLGRGRHRVALRAGQRMNMKDRGTAAHDLDRLPVPIVAPLVTGGLGPGIKQRVQRTAPDAAVRRQPVTSGLAEDMSRGDIAAHVVSSARRGGPVNRTAMPVAASMRPASTAAAPIPASGSVTASARRKRAGRPARGSGWIRVSPT